MAKKRGFVKVVALLLLIGIFAGIGYFIFDKSAFMNPTYVVTYDVNGGVCDKKEDQVRKNNTIDLPVPTKVGYEFDGWYHIDKKWTGSSKVKGNMTLVAKWNILKYDITFMVEGEAKVVGSNWGTIPDYGATPTKQSTNEFMYDFVGWVPALEIVTQNATYTAQFSERALRFNVQFDANGGYSTASSEEIVPNSKITLPVATRQGYEFLGWFYGDTKWDDSMNVVFDMTLVAKWEILKFDITFIVDGVVTTKTFNYGEFPSYGSVPVKPATNYFTFEFSHWTPALADVVADEVYTAMFTETAIVYEINPILEYVGACDLTGGGTFLYGDDTVIEISNIKPGYRFDGWFKNGALYSLDTSIVLTDIHEDFSVKARFTLLEATITYSLGVPGLVLENPNPTTYYANDGIIELVAPERDGYELLGWYSNGNKITHIDCSEFENYELNALWKFITYTISYDLAGGTVSGTNPTTYTIENVEITVINPIKPDHDFIGWIGTGLLDPTQNLVIPTGSMGNRSYTAVWRSDAYMVSYVVDGMPLSAHYTNLDADVPIAVPVVDCEDYDMSGYEIDGWYTEASCINKYTFGGLLDADITLYGRWNYFIGEGFYGRSAKFASANTSTPINIDSYEELVEYVEYVAFYDVTAKNLVKLTYKNLSGNSLLAEMQNAVDDSSYPLYVGMKYLIGENSQCGLYVSSSVRNVEASYVCDPQKTSICEQLQSGNYEVSVSTRNSAYDEFPVFNVKKTLEVETSNQLIYALENGLAPVCKKGSDAEKVLNQAKQVLREICDNTMTKIEKARAIYDWIIMNVAYDNRAVSTSSVLGNWWLYDTWYAEGVFDNGVAVCDGIAKAYLIMARLEGIPTIRMNSDDHTWNKVYIDGEWYGVDPTHGNVLMNGSYEVLTYTAFMFTDSYKIAKGDVSYNYDEIVADTVFNYYDYAEYEVGGVTYDFNIDSAQEFKALLEYCDDEAITSTFMTIEFVVDESFTNFEAVLSDASTFSGVSFDARYEVTSLTDSAGNTIYILLVA